MRDPNPDAVSIDTIIKALYESISGPAGAPRQWERDRALYAPGALLIPMRPPNAAMGANEGAEILDFDGYVKSRTPFFAASSFYEVEIARKEFHFGAMAHVLSAYEGRDAPNGKILKRGINSIQLFHDGARWWVASIMWDNERDGVTLPAEFGV
ncbi:MAG TPA: nuclear transport factor 2 family protein [Thermoanaerobaculia bacterium]